MSRLITQDEKRAHAVKHARDTVTFRTKHTEDGYEVVWCTKCLHEDRRKIDTAPRLVAEGEA